MIMPILLAWIILLFVCDVKGQLFTCPTLPATYSNIITCSGVVDYSFYLPSGSTNSDLEYQARSLLKNLTVAIGATCISSIKKQVCAVVYLPCISGVIPGDTSTYQKGTNLPYKRPCSDLCTTIYSTDTCSSSQIQQMEYYNYNFPNCSAIDSTTDLPVYDSSNNSTTCNNLLSTQGQLVVSNDVETYNGTLCKGLLTSFVVGDSNSINSTLAPLLPEYELQKYLETKYSNLEMGVPHTFNSNCLNIQKKLLCGSIFPHPGVYYVAGVIPVDVPNFPLNQNCLDYHTECAALIPHSPSLDINCSMTTILSGTVVKSFPATTQIVGYALGSFPVYSEPYDLTDMNSPNLTTECPDGFSVPDDPYGDGTLMVTDACAMNCPAPIYSHKSKNMQNTAIWVTSWLNTVFGCIQITNLYHQKIEKQSLLLYANLFAILSYEMYDAFQRTIIVPNPDKLVCQSSNQWHAVEAPSSTDETGINAVLARNCDFYSLLCMYADYIFNVCILIIVVELWFKIIADYDITHLRIIYCLIGLLYAIGNGLIITLYNGAKMINPGQPGTKCIYAIPDLDKNYLYRYLSDVAFYAVIVVLSMHIFFHCFYLYNNYNVLFKQIWKKSSTLLLFITVYILFFGPIDIWVNTFINLTEAPKMKSSTQDWVTCIFENFNTYADQSYVNSLCGIYPSFTIPVSTLIPILSLPVLYNFAVVIITLDTDVMLYWRELFLKISSYFKSDTTESSCLSRLPILSGLSCLEFSNCTVCSCECCSCDCLDLEPKMKFDNESIQVRENPVRSNDYQMNTRNITFLEQSQPPKSPHNNSNGTANSEGDVELHMVVDRTNRQSYMIQVSDVYKDSAADQFFTSERPNMNRKS